MRILITGGAGFIGSNLVRLLVRSGHTVLNVDKLTYAGNLQSLADIAHQPNYHFQRICIANSEAIRSTLLQYKPDAVMHLAAESHVDRSIDGPGEFIQTNVVGTFNLLQASLEHWRSLPDDAATKFRFLHVSTDEVYGSLGPEGKFTEETRYDPHSPYSASKASSDHLVRAWHDTYGLPVLVTNCSNNYGPYQFPEKLIPLVILKCLRGEPIPVYGRGENIRDWLYVEDHCRALVRVLTKGKSGQTYNIGGNNERRNIDLVHLLCKLMDEMRGEVSSEYREASGEKQTLSNLFSLAPSAGRGTEGEGPINQAPRTKNQELASFSELITFVPDRPGHDHRYAIDTSKIERELGWMPTQDHESGFLRTVRWYLENESWWQSILSGTYKLERWGVDG